MFKDLLLRLRRAEGNVRDPALHESEGQRAWCWRQIDDMFNEVDLDQVEQGLERQAVVVQGHFLVLNTVRLVIVVVALVVAIITIGVVLATA